MMKKILCLILALAMVLSAAAFAENAQGDSPEAILSGMSLRDKVAQMMIASFRVWQEVPPEGEEMPEEEPPRENITRLNDDIEATIENIGRMGRDGMQNTDVEILNIMVGNGPGSGLPYSAG